MDDRRGRSEPTHAQSTAQVTPEVRRRTARGADLARRDPATWQMSVRYGDMLMKEGMPADQAHQQSLDAFDPDGHYHEGVTEDGVVRCRWCGEIRAS